MKLSLLLTAAVLASCGGDDEGPCGPGDAAGPIRGAFDDTEVTWEQFTSSANNDCSVDGAPISQLLEGRQPETGRLLVLCLPRPDKLGDGPNDLSDESQIQVISMFADESDCLISHDRSRDIVGTVDFTGHCDDGSDPAGYAVTFDATVPITIKCGDDETTSVMTVSGTAPVAEVTP